MSTTKFDLSTAISSGGAVTRDGRSVSNLHYPNQTHDPYPLIGRLDGEVQLWRLDGRFIDDNSEHPNDLVHPSVEIAPEQAATEKPATRKFLVVVDAGFKKASLEVAVEGPMTWNVLEEIRLKACRKHGLNEAHALVVNFTPLEA
jgi:hypothetical protein